MNKHFLFIVHFAKYTLCIIMVHNPFLEMKHVKQKEILWHEKDWEKFWLKSKDTKTQKWGGWGIKTMNTKTIKSKFWLQIEIENNVI